MGYIGKTPTKVPLTSSDIANDIINSDHIGDTAISGFSALSTAPADTDEFLISDAGVLKRLDASLVGGGLDNWSESSGNLLPSNASYGIYLGVNSATAANLLDDYEEGTFTPAFGNGNGLDSISQSGSGRYTKIGQFVHCILRVSTSSATKNGNRLEVTGLPFTSYNTGTLGGAGVFSYANPNFSSTDNQVIHLFVPSNASKIGFYKSNGNNFTGSNINDEDNIDIYISVTYMSA